MGVKPLPVMWEIQVRSLGWEDALKKEMAIHCSILSWKIPEEPGRLQTMGSQRVSHGLSQFTSFYFLKILCIYSSVKYWQQQGSKKRIGFNYFSKI